MAPLPPLPNLNTLGTHTLHLLNTAASTLRRPTRTLNLNLLTNRQTTNPNDATVTLITGTTTPTEESSSSPDDAATLSGGAIAGIVIGSIVGFLLLVWIIRSYTNLGAPPGEDAVPGRPWYGGVREAEHYPPGGHHGEPRRRGRSRGSRRSEYGYGGGHHYHDHGSHHHHHGGGSRSRSRRVSAVVPVQEVAPVVVRDGGYRNGRSPSRSRSRSRGYYGYGEGEVGRSRSRGRY